MSFCISLLRRAKSNKSPPVRVLLVSADRWSVSTRCLAATTKMKGREKQVFDEVSDLLSQDLTATQTHAGDVSIMFSSMLAGWFTDICGTDFLPRN